MAALCRLPEVGQPALAGTRHRIGDLVQLPQGAVVVVRALHQQQRGDLTAFMSDVKGAEGLGQPHVVPLSKSTVHVGRVLDQTLPWFE